MILFLIVVILLKEIFDVDYLVDLQLLRLLVGSLLESFLLAQQFALSSLTFRVEPLQIDGSLAHFLWQCLTDVLQQSPGSVLGVVMM